VYEFGFVALLFECVLEDCVDHLDLEVGLHFLLDESKLVPGLQILHLFFDEVFDNVDIVNEVQYETL
jgi:hypothetical protein